MSIRDDLKSVLKELSSILAGFKLALIVISYFGLGSVAKWVISHWYPFTRWIWDRFCVFFSLPTFPDVLKDSLTALVFFLPLGIVAIYEFFSDSDPKPSSFHRWAGLVFGFAILYIICREVILIIADALGNIDGPIDLETFIESLWLSIGVPDWLAPFLTIILIAMPAAAFSILALSGRDRVLGFQLIEIKKLFSRTISTLGAFWILYMVYAFASGLVENDWAIFLSATILFFILGLLLAAVVYTPKKLFITTGASLAFVLAAVVFEIAIFVINFIESAPSA
ncbi:MAG: hypothetical protein AAGK71_13580 [Pseudomonadota bacterium]